MKVYIDDQIFGLQPRGGISRYFVELARAFREDAGLDVEVTTPSLWTINEHLLEAGGGRRLPTRLGDRRRILRAVNRLSAPNRSDVVHHTYYDAAYLTRGGSDSLRVTTVYDMIPELLPENFPDGNPHLDKRAYVEAADLVLCISESTKNDLLDVYGPVRAPIRVIPLGVDPRFGHTSPRPARFPERYVLFVGNRGGYKDFSVLAEAFAAARLPDDVALMAVGGGRFTEEELRLLGRLGLAAQARQAALRDDEMPGAYAHAVCFVFPSRYEGFGLPTVEAMAAGSPVVLADTSSNPEVGGDVALYFDPGDAEGLSRLLQAVWEDPADRAHRALRGRDRARLFTWANTARLTAAAYRAHARVRSPATR